MTTRFLRSTLAAALAPLAAAGSATAATIPQRPTNTTTWIAQLFAAVSVRLDPDPSARQVVALQPLAPLGGGITTLQVIDRRPGADGRLWIKVLVPQRPNGSSGWVPASQVRLLTTPLRIRIDLGDRRLTLYRSGRVVKRIRVAVGAPGTPTPTGRFAVAEVIRTHHPGGFLGPVVFPLTGFSNVLNEYAGGNGRVAMHGTSLPELIGTRASHGCIRIRNADVAWMARHVRPGVPVTITW